MTRPIQFTESQTSEIIRLYKKHHKTARYIAGQFGVSDHVIKRILTENGIKGPRNDMRQHHVGCPGIQWHDGLGLQGGEDDRMFKVSCEYFAHYARCKACTTWQPCTEYDGLCEKWMAAYYRSGGIASPVPV